MNEKRETLFEDRTHCHADHVVQGMDRGTTAAVGVLKAVKFEEDKDMFESRYANGNLGLLIVLGGRPSLLGHGSEHMYISASMYGISR